MMRQDGFYEYRLMLFVHFFRSLNVVRLAIFFVGVTSALGFVAVEVGGNI